MLGSYITVQTQCKMEVQKFRMYEKHKKYLYFVLAVVITYMSVQREITVAEKRLGGTGCYTGPKIMLPIWYQQPSLSVNGISLLFEEAAAADKPNRVWAYSTYKIHFYTTWVAENQMLTSQKTFWTLKTIIITYTISLAVPPSLLGGALLWLLFLGHTDWPFTSQQNNP